MEVKSVSFFLFTLYMQLYLYTECLHVSKITLFSYPFNNVDYSGIPENFSMRTKSAETM